MYGQILYDICSKKVRSKEFSLTNTKELSHAGFNAQNIIPRVRDSQDDFDESETESQVVSDSTSPFIDSLSCFPQLSRVLILLAHPIELRNLPPFFLGIKFG